MKDDQFIIHADSTGTVIGITKPLKLRFDPHEDITTFELAQCMQFLFSHMILPKDFDRNAGYAKHWHVSDPNFYPDVTSTQVDNATKTELKQTHK